MKTVLCLLTSLTVLHPTYETKSITHTNIIHSSKTFDVPYKNLFPQDFVSTKENKNSSNTDGDIFEMTSPNVISKPKIEKSNKSTTLSFLNSLLQYEQMSIYIYNNCATTKLMSEPVSKIIQTHLKRHHDYRDLLINAIKKLGGKVEKPNNTYDLAALHKFFGLNTIATEKDILTLTAKTEEYGLNLYNSSISYIDHKETVKLTTTILSMIGRHSAMLHTLVGQEFIKYPKDLFNFPKPVNKPSNKDIKALSLLFSLENEAVFVYEAVVATKLLATPVWTMATKFRDIHKENILKLQNLGAKADTSTPNYDLISIAKSLGVNNLSREKDLKILLDKIEEKLCKEAMNTVEILNAKNFIYTFIHISVLSGQMNSIWDATLDRYKEVSYL